MRLIDYLNELTFLGQIDKFYQIGMIGIHWLSYRDVYNMRDVLLKQGVKRNDSIYQLEIRFGYSRSMIYKILAKMEEEV
jgi:hypothetical protein